LKKKGEKDWKCRGAELCRKKKKILKRGTSGKKKTLPESGKKGPPAILGPGR